MPVAINYLTMRHGKKFNHLGRKASHRKAMLRNMAISLIEHKRIVTTTAKAKALRKFVEPLVTKAIQDYKAQGNEAKKNPHQRRVIFSYLNNKDAVTELFGVIAPTIGDRPGGYTRILKIGNRQGDNADMSMIEFVDFNEYGADKPGGRKKSRRRRRRGSTKAAAETTAVEEAVVEEAQVVEETAAEVVETVEETAAEVVAEAEEVVEEATEVAEEAAEEVADAAEEATEENNDEEKA